MRRIIFLFVANLDLPYFSTLSHIKHHFKKKLLNVNLGFDCFFNSCLVLRRTELNITINAHKGLFKVPVILSDINEICNFSTDFRKNKEI